MGKELALSHLQTLGAAAPGGYKYLLQSAHGDAEHLPAAPVPTAQGQFIAEAPALLCPLQLSREPFVLMEQTSAALNTLGLLATSTVQGEKMRNPVGWAEPLASTEGLAQFSPSEVWEIRGFEILALPSLQ